MDKHIRYNYTKIQPNTSAFMSFSVVQSKAHMAAVVICYKSAQ